MLPTSLALHFVSPIRSSRSTASIGKANHLSILHIHGPRGGLGVAGVGGRVASSNQRRNGKSHRNGASTKPAKVHFEERTRIISLGKKKHAVEAHVAHRVEILAGSAGAVRCCWQEAFSRTGWELRRDGLTLYCPSDTKFFLNTISSRLGQILDDYPFHALIVRQA